MTQLLSSTLIKQGLLSDAALSYLGQLAYVLSDDSLG